ncbi:hypothetical protein NLI96_g10449 [Meripilus lineatus]|uniref:non-chaperonin molecular chaperone ATPase n=1 Tax=Meripilus lineatus TaxID=2056292 RepID=A0AAD5UTN3_9APHY|nr:hypothetical protein NLI96_g10449 [Physisporinus lineatus]
MSVPIGIDFGTSSSCVSVWRQGRATPILNDWGNLTTPSFVSFTDKGRLFGDAAKYRASKHPSNTVFDFKRLLGRKFSDPEVQHAVQTSPYGIVERHGIPYIRVVSRREMKEYTPQEIVAMFLLRLKEIAEVEQGAEVTQAVIAVPSFFTFVQREAIRDAAQIAGLRTLRMVDEPTAATLHYLISRSGDEIKEKNVIVIDLGASSLDISVSVIEDNVLEVKATASNPDLGGSNFDDRLVAHFASDFKSRHHKGEYPRSSNGPGTQRSICRHTDIYGYPRALQKLRDACERLRKCLSFTSQIPLEIDSLVEGIGLYSIYTQTKFEELCEDLFQMVFISVEQALREAKLERHEIHEVVMTGGSSRVPRIIALVTNFFGGKAPCLLDPDSSVANESRDLPSVLLLDIVPHTLGVETNGGTMTPIVKRSVTIPTKKSTIMTTVWDYQPGIVIRVYEGNHRQARDNLFLGRLELSLGSPPQPRGVPRIEIAFDIEGNSEVIVTVRLLGTAESTTLTLHRGRLSRDVVHRMQWEAREYRAQEKKDAARRFAAQTDPESQAYYMLSLMDDDGIESQHTYQQRPPPYHDEFEGETLFESSQREYDRSDRWLDFEEVH